MKYGRSRPRLIGREDLHGSQQTRPSGRFVVRRWSDRGECCRVRSRARPGPGGSPTRLRGAPPRGRRPEAGVRLRLLPALLRARVWLGSVMLSEAGRELPRPLHFLGWPLDRTMVRSSRFATAALPAAAPRAPRAPALAARRPCPLQPEPVARSLPAARVARAERSFARECRPRRGREAEASL